MSTFAAIEAGGTKFVCAVGSGPDDFRHQEIPTTSPHETLERAIRTLLVLADGEDIRALGIGSFGPIDMDPKSDTYGFITSTPKAGWRNTDVVGAVARAINVPIGFDTDVNAAMLAEARWGAARDLSNAIYVTVGTGIGGGALVEGKLLHGVIHPEIGHMRVPHDLEQDSFRGSCPYHGDCLEGLASGAAIAARWGEKGECLPEGHPAWKLEARYLAAGLLNLTVMLSPERIIIGGGVMHSPSLWAFTRSSLQELLNGYLRYPNTANDMESFVVPAQLGNNAGVLGSLALAIRLCE